MSFMFVFVFLIIVGEIAGVRHQLDDNHPFIDDLMAREKHEKFMLIPSIGFEDNGRYTLLINGWYYQPSKTNFLHNVIKGSFEMTLHLFDQEEEFSEEEKQERLGPFFVEDIANHEIQLRLSKSVSRTVFTDENGRFNATIVVDSLDKMNIRGPILKYTASDKDSNEQGDEGWIYLMKNRRGCSIISDIDDTIKISEVPDKTKLAVNTFKKDFREVPGMSNLYRAWRSSHHCLIHYVSAMPSQLYYVTQKFLNRERFPSGSFHMRHLKLVAAERSMLLISKVIDFAKRDSSQTHKLEAIKNIFDHAPIGQQFVMVGDSGELDPEIYGQIARRYPDRIKVIFIRIVEGGDNDDSRFDTAFREVATEKWRTFTNAKELPKTIFDEKDGINTDDDDDDGANKATVLSTSFYYHLLVLLFTILCV